MLNKLIARNKNTGFTLIELLVVIAIIGVLAAVVLVSLNTARVRGRDARRIADMGSIVAAIELYNDRNNSYPPIPVANKTAALLDNAYTLLVSLLRADGVLGQAGRDPRQTVDDPDARYAYRYGYLDSPRYGAGANNCPGVTGRVAYVLGVSTIESITPPTAQDSNSTAYPALSGDDDCRYQDDAGMPLMECDDDITIAPSDTEPWMYCLRQAR